MVCGNILDLPFIEFVLFISAIGSEIQLQASLHIEFK
jgi:hypothetical protein